MAFNLPRNEAAFQQARIVSFISCIAAINSGSWNHNFFRILSASMAAFADITGKWAGKIASGRREKNGQIEEKVTPEAGRINLIEGFEEWAAKHPVALTYSLKIPAIIPLAVSGVTQQKWGEVGAASVFLFMHLLGVSEKKLALKTSSALQAAAGVMIISAYFTNRGNLFDLIAGTTAVYVGLLSSRIDPQVYQRMASALQR